MRLTVDALLEWRGADLLARLVDCMRPSPAAPDAAENVSALAAWLKATPAARRHLASTARRLVADSEMVNALDEGGILPDSGLLEGLRRLGGDRILGRVYPPDDLRVLMQTVFRKADDWVWVGQIDTEVWARLIDLTTKPGDAIGIPHDDVGSAIIALAQRIGAVGIDAEVHRMLEEVDSSDSPFLQITIRAHEFLEDHRSGRGTAATYASVRSCARDCRKLILKLRDDKAALGTSLRLTRLSRRMLQQLQRFELLLRFVRPDNARGLARSMVPLLKNLLKAEQTAGSVRRFIRHHVDLLAYQIVEHTADKGEKFIPRTIKEYVGFLFAAMGGGAFVAAFAVFKLFLFKLELPLAVQALLYGLNYSICFVLIFLSGAILATKAPATTGSTVARLIDSADSRSGNLNGVADLIVLVWRGQFVSFLGNLVCAFPFAIAIAFLLELLFGVTTADVEKSQALLDANHPWESGALFYAAIAGVCLFIAGVIQGSVENRIVYSRIRERLLNHTGFGRKKQAAIDFVMRNASGIVGNMALGFMLGSAGTIGTLFGLPLDIRHIAFSSSHLGVATLDAPQLVEPATVGVVMLGILGIGLINFGVSFGLTVFVAFLSRRISLAQSRGLLSTLLIRILYKPLHWFFPLGQYDVATTTGAVISAGGGKK